MLTLDPTCHTLSPFQREAEPKVFNTLAAWQRAGKMGRAQDSSGRVQLAPNRRLPPGLHVPVKPLSVAEGGEAPSFVPFTQWASWGLPPEGSSSPVPTVWETSAHTLLEE